MVDMDMTDPTITKRKMGRPLSFERDVALEKAMLAFWQNGYETTSIADLTKAMGVTAPSIYAAFGDKRQLFLEAVRRYAGTDEQIERGIASMTSGFDAAKALLMTSAEVFTGEDTPPGCLLASATASGSAAAADVRAIVSTIRNKGRAALRRCIERDIANSRLPSGTDAQGLADFVYATVQGMSVLARDGATRPEIKAIAIRALSAWPAVRPTPRKAEQ